jgi:hypothetical protein
MEKNDMYAILRSEFQQEGIRLIEEKSIWTLLSHYRDEIKGCIIYNADDESLNTATSLCGLKYAVAIEQGPGGGLGTDGQRPEVEEAPVRRGVGDVPLLENLPKDLPDHFQIS